MTHRVPPGPNDAGYEAGLKGVYKNPYPPGCEDYILYREGFEEAEEDLISDKEYEEFVDFYDTDSQDELYDDNFDDPTY